VTPNAQRPATRAGHRHETNSARQQVHPEVYFALGAWWVAGLWTIIALAVAQ